MKLLLLLSVYITILTVGADIAIAKYSGGNGTNTSPYLISSGSDFFNIGQNPEDWNSTFQQTGHITMGSYSDQPEATLYTPPGIDFFTPFTGRYYGNGFEIRNLSIEQNQDELGLFGFVAGGAILSNIHLTNTTITGRNNVSGLAATLFEASAVNCSVNGTISGTGIAVGLVSINGGEIDSCNCSGAVISTTSASGLCGNNMYYNSDFGIEVYGIIDSCYSEALVAGDRNAAGLCLENTGISYYIPDYHASINNCYAIGDVTSGGYAAGLCLINADGATIDNCYSNNSVTGITYVGGLVAENLGASISGSYSSGSINGSGYVGGICAYNDGLGDLAGWIDCSFANCDISVEANNSIIGGLCGYNAAGIVVCFAYNNINADGNNNTIGGLIGRNNYCIDSYSYGSISVTGDNNNVGGFAGMSGFTGQSYERGTVSVSGEYNTVGPFYAINNYFLEACFWDIEAMGVTDPENGSADTDGVIGVTTAEMMDINTFLTAGWDFAGETTNGTIDYWEMGLFPATYCQNYINLFDFSIMAECWMSNECQLSSDCHVVDIIVDGCVDIKDFSVWVGYWLTYDPIIRIH